MPFLPALVMLAMTRSNPLDLYSGHAAGCCAAMGQFAADPKFVAVHLRPAPLNWQATTGHNVTFPSAQGPKADGFYVPPSAGSHSAIVLVHEWWGLNDYIRRVAEKLHADTGYAVLAIDLYDGKSTSDPNEAGKLMNSVDQQRCASIALGGLMALEKGHFGFKPKTIGTVGYCFGGGWSERAAILGSAHVQACVIYYGLPDTRPQSLERLKAPVLMFQGKKDAWINDKVVADFQSAMKLAGKSLEVHSYDDDHAFANPSNPHYDPVATADAYRRELAFYKAHL